MNNLPPVKATLDVTPVNCLVNEDGEIEGHDAGMRPNLVNKVVRVPSRPEFDYYYVLHFIKDMDWCHVVPMREFGTFQGSTVRAGRPRYKLVPEGEGREIDLPASM